MKNYKKVLLAAAALLVALTVAACSNGSNGQSSSQGSSSSSSQESSSSSSDASDAENEPLVYYDTNLGFKVELPELLRNHTKIETTEREGHTEKVTSVMVYYIGEGDTQVNVFSFDEMSSGEWEKTKEAGGPLGTVLGESEDGRVVVFNTLQSNPFMEGDPEYELFNELPGQMGIIQKTFQFLDSEEAAQ